MCSAQSFMAEHVKVCSDRFVKIKFKKKLDKSLINVYLIIRLKNMVSVFLKD